MDAQVESAIQIAFDPRADQNLKAQAYEFLQQLRDDASGWQVCLALFTRDPPPDEVVRHVCLELVSHAVQTARLDEQSLSYIKDQLMTYIHQTFANHANRIDSPSIQNKLTQTVTYLFTSLYATAWPTFFEDFRTLAGDASTIGSDNPQGTILYLRIINSIHDEIADVLIPRTPEELKRNADLKDYVRSRDAQNISAFWQQVLARWRQIDLSIVELCLRCVARWVSWIDISLVVNENMLNFLLEIAGQPDIASAESPQAKVRDAAIDTFTEIVAKKMPSQDKIQLISYLNLANVAGQLVASSALNQSRGTSNYDNDLGETVAKLVNNVVFDVVKVLDSEGLDANTAAQADELLQLFVPYLLRFFSDEYDEICSAVIPSLTDLLTLFRVSSKRGALPDQYRAMLQPILDTIILKMKYDETADWGAESDQTDEAEFQELRRRLHVLQQAVAAVDENMYMETLSRVVATTFNRISSDNKPNWRDLDLALYEMYLFGELAIKNGGLYQKSSPSSTASQHLIEMMAKLVESDIASYPHPAVQLQYMEICVRYCTFFEHSVESIPRVLENFVRFVHSDHIKIKTRSWYLFFRFVKQLRSQLGNVAQTVIETVADLLTINAEVPKESDDDDMSSEENDQSADAIFTSQLYLFEAVGAVASTTSVPLENRMLYARTLVTPLIADLERHIPAAKNGDERAILQVHHIIQAVGTLAKGFCDWMPGNTSGAPPPSELANEFSPAGEAVLTALESLKNSMLIRTGARFAFSRMLGVLGSGILQKLPRWIDGLLSQSSTKDEMATFLRLLDQVVFGFKAEIIEILDQLLTPLLQRVLAGLSEPTNGTDDAIQLGELKMQYLQFILVILNNDLAPVLVSSANQQTFETILTTLEHFCRDTSDYPTARLSLGVLTKMTQVWGGPDLTIPIPPGAAQVAAPTVPGFDTFIMSRFSPLTWALITQPSFQPKDAQARSYLTEAATLQWTILRKCGAAYATHLRGSEMSGLGLQGPIIDEYIKHLEAKDKLDFKKFFIQFVQQVRS
ncbi:hypothetical protein QM012_002934 [Aureobasidium pullulans]|uniref:Exportin-T n=1 Tax=Aureobasidium pullulans TaxID=5580 RepID=A0ABR0TAY1_AURPU